MAGFCARVGERRKRDAALSLQQMLGLQGLFKEEWGTAAQANDEQGKREVPEIAVFFLLGCCASLRGFEMPKTALHKVRGRAQPEGQGGVAAHVAAPLQGRLKAQPNQITEILACAVAVMASGLQPGLWASHLVGALEGLGVITGWLFQEPDGSPRKMTSFGDTFFGHLLALQDQDPTLLSLTATSLRVSDWLARPARGQGGAVRAMNAGTPQPDIGWIN